jgi:UPF0755 protein
MIRKLIPTRHRDRAGVLVLSGIFFVLWLLLQAPTDFPLGTVAVVESGISISAAGAALKADHVIRSPTIFSILVRTFGGEVKAGGYVFEHAPTLVEVAWQVAHGGNAPQVKVTVPEGASVREIGGILGDVLPDFDTAAFIKIAHGDEGYLFPETYFFTPGTSPATVVTAMRRTFDENVVTLKPDIASSTHPLSDLVIMASLLEKEARKPDTRAVIAGILWKRVALGIPLQVDAVFGYIEGTTTFSPSLDELKVVSPYNTYTHLGLPPGPIGNPGLASLGATLHPTKTPYLYYLTGSDGVMHYAATFAGHMANRKYLQ